MKKNHVLVLLLVALFIIPSVNAQVRIKNRQSISTSVSGFRLINPVDNWQFGKYPIDIKFEWTNQPGYPSYTIELEYYDNGNWRDYVTKSSLTKPFTVIRYAMDKGFRWRVTSHFRNGQNLVSKYHHVKYVPGRKMGKKNLVPQFHPVPIAPLNKALFKNYPRNITFKWLHSTNPAFRNYQIQVDIYHPNPKRWQSEMRNKTYILNDVTKGTSYSWRFPADRYGRWRVRGYKNQKKATPWSQWNQFSFRARH